MQRDDNHLIGEEAERILTGAVPRWLVNAQVKDYGKDYFVELCDEPSKKLTNQHFLVQLKGQKKVSVSVDRQSARFQLDFEHADAYHNTHDLPVFLVLVDVVKKDGWYAFLQPLLQDSQKWRKQKSSALYVPFSNSINDEPAFRRAVEEAKQWLQVNHPTAIEEAIEARKRQIAKKDPRFTANLGTRDGKPEWRITPINGARVDLTMRGPASKMQELIDTGRSVIFEPGEIEIVGLALFEDIKATGALFQGGLARNATCTLINRDADGNEVHRINDVPGRVTGGRKEQQFEGHFPNSPLAVAVGPIGVGLGGSVTLTLQFQNWNGQPLRQLAYFDRLYGFLMSLKGSATTEAIIQIDGNDFFSAAGPQMLAVDAQLLGNYLEAIHRARFMTERFGVNPTWTFSKFDAEECETADQLFEIFVEGGWCRGRPRMEVEFSCQRDGFNWNALENAPTPGDVQLIMDWSFSLLGEHVTTARLATRFLRGHLRLSDSGSAPRSRKRKSTKRKTRSRSSGDAVDLHFVGTQATMLELRLPTAEDEKPT